MNTYKIHVHWRNSNYNSLRSYTYVRDNCTLEEALAYVRADRVKIHPPTIEFYISGIDCIPSTPAPTSRF